MSYVEFGRGLAAERLYTSILPLDRRFVLVNALAPEGGAGDNCLHARIRHLSKDVKDVALNNTIEFELTRPLVAAWLRPGRQLFELANQRDHAKAL
jgi:hypothetical protein